MVGHGNHGRRLSTAERLEIRHRVARGETHAAVAGAVGCSSKSIQRLSTPDKTLPSFPNPLTPASDIRTLDSLRGGWDATRLCRSRWSQ